MNLSKSYEFFRPEDCNDRIHIIGCGAIGSTVAENLARLGLTKISLYDFDVVEDKNIANQMFTTKDLGRPKVEAVADMICRINPDIKQDLRVYPMGWKNHHLSGYVFLCVDNIDLRREIATSCVGNQFIRGIFDYRMGLTSAQHYAADWKDDNLVRVFLNSMQFSHEEAMQETPVSACNQVLSVAPTVRTIVALGVSNFMNFIKKHKLKKLILMDAFAFSVEAFD